MQFLIVALLFFPTLKMLGAISWPWLAVTLPLWLPMAVLLAYTVGWIVWYNLLHSERPEWKGEWGP
jgi:hypothetical protein